MALTRLTADLSFISKLDNEPSDNSGMTPSLLKAKFDAGSNALKTFINETLIPELDTELLSTLAGGFRAVCAVLSASGWSENEQTVSVTGVTALNTVIVVPSPASQAAYLGAGVVCTEQENGTLGFVCSATPASNITVNILISGVVS